MNFAQLLFPDFSLILCGYLVCRYTALNRTVWEQVEALVYFLFFPVLLFHSIVKSPLDIASASSLIGAGWAMGLTGIALAYSLPYWPWLGRRIDRRDHAASAQVAFRFNSFIGLALADRLAGPQGLLLIAVLIGVCVPLFNIGAVWPMARHAQRGLRLGGSTELGEPIGGPMHTLLTGLDGLTVVPLDRRDECCGFGGSFSVAEPEVSAAMGRDRIRDYKKHDAGVLVSSDVSCLLHLTALAPEMRTLHIGELLEEATR